MDAGPAQAGTRMVTAPRPTEALPELFLIEVLMLRAVEDEGGLHHIAHRFAL
ncbi:hypothetical protein D3C75_1319360 [compost metagenome]